MVPSLFTCANAPRAGEHDVASGWNNTTFSRQLLERHWDSFIQETDFAYLHSIGINTVRLPIGYWSLGPQFCVGTAFEDVMSVYGNSWKRVLRAINTAGAYGIGVLVDLHGAPGSQNGESSRNL
jgi:glucan 1,3-beta-glucosidase